MKIGDRVRVLSAPADLPEDELYTRSIRPPGLGIGKRVGQFEDSFHMRFPRELTVTAASPQPPCLREVLRRLGNARHCFREDLGCENRGKYAAREIARSVGII